jgi:hypothetical protein
VTAAAATAPAPAAAEPGASITPPDGVQHLPSPDSLPPGTTQQAPDHPNVGYLREIWHALRNGDVSGSDALLLLGTRPVDPGKLAGSTPSNQVGPSAPAGADVPAPASAAPASAPASAAPAGAEPAAAPSS